MVHETDSSRDRSRRAFMGTIGATGLGLAASTSVAASSDGDPTPIDSPTVIEEPGEYELVADLAPEELEQSGCIVVDLRDERGELINRGEFTLYGNGHTIDLTDTEFEPERSRQRLGGLVFNPGRRWNELPETQWEMAVDDLEIRGGGSGISSRLAGGGAFTDVTLVDNGVGFDSYVSGGGFRNCVVAENDTGIVLGGDTEVWGGAGSAFENCTIRSNGGPGIVVGAESQAQIETSRIVRNRNGILAAAQGSSTVIERSHICHNEEYGVYGDAYPELVVDESESWPAQEARVQAIDNYWGAANGPSSLERRWSDQDTGYEYVAPDEPFTDSETGRPADGDGDAISKSLESGVSNVRFDPFHEGPLEDVGAQR
ncbi:right-handed parallel beta-helix repeat-containing protein [Natronococcus sp. JC468]|uniref:right-handed parallel beta-helix repeat-containing protein n=1 Tax=Natronococcus sp. JC468 TaxID=1961921 RepID=UPI00143C852D|nr:right-handed parallel beta-helix repeat-containing protein [Natronococcus sp. JC468]NKE35172.1 right-handed parallel beta-helix repeat-containing protein [Natronococcus sp. JC468]